MRYFLEFAYNGTHYHGWQIQPNAVTVQEVLTRAFRLLLKSDIELTAAGRTDAGVHAKQMYAHFDYTPNLDKIAFLKRLNSFLPEDIVVHHLHDVPQDAHARFDATSRTYEYHIHTFKDAFLNPFSWYYYRPLHIQKMNEAARILCEYEDFECFSKSNSDVHTFICQISHAAWIQEGHRLIFSITANRFLRNMVRAVVGTLIDVGLEKTNAADLRSIIESKNRSKAGFSVPGKGLFLTQVTYPYIHEAP